MTSFPNPPGASLPPGHPLQAWQQYWQLMAGDPDKLRQWQQQWLAQHAQLWDQLLHRRAGEPAEPVVPQVRGDKRFSSPAWQESPIFDYLRQAYWINAQMLTRWVEESDFPDGKTKARARFLVRQIVDALAPSNFAATNPEFIRQALETQGESIAMGVALVLVGFAVMGLLFALAA